MALPSTMHVFHVDLSDTRRGVYEALEVKVARHPSETVEAMVTRVLAYALEHSEGLAMGPGLCDAAEPALAVRDLTGALRTWIDVGTPDVARLHKAAKAADRVVVYCHKPVDGWLANLAGERVHRADRIALYAFDPAFVGALAARVARRARWTLSVVDQGLYLDTGDHVFETELRTLSWPS